MDVYKWYADSYTSYYMRFHIVIFITSWGFSAGTFGALDGLEGIHLQGASSLLHDGVFDRDIWQRSPSLWWVVMLDVHIVV